MKKYRMAAGAGVLLIIGVITLHTVWPGAGIFPVRLFSTERLKSLSAIRAEEDAWKKEIQTVGPKAAYEELVASSRDLSNAQQHARAHVFGGALFSTEGLPGLTVCDDRLFSGCFHEFLGRAITALGPDTVTKLNDVCLAGLQDPRDAVNCQHGIGHGILAYYGYTPDDLTKALRLCGTLQSVDHVRGCEGGVFMEHNLETMTGTYVVADVSSVAKRNVECDGVPESFRQACLFWSPQLWERSLESGQHPGPEEVFKTMGLYCTEMSGGSPEACFAGIGYIAGPAVGFDAAKTAQLCASTSPDPAYRVSCWDTALGGLGLTRSAREAASGSVCAGLSGASQTRCDTLVHADVGTARGTTVVQP